MTTRDKINKKASSQGWKVNYERPSLTQARTDFTRGTVRISVTYTSNLAVYCAYLIDKTNPQADYDGIVSEIGGGTRDKAARVIDWLETEGLEFA